MAGRWQLSLWVLAGLILTVVALWDNASVSAVAGRVSERTETVDGPARPGSNGSPPFGLAFHNVDGSSLDGGDAANVLRPTTTTTTRPTTTTSTRPPGDSTESDTTEPESATTTLDAAEEPTTTTTVSATSSTAADGDPASDLVFHEDFAAGALAAEQWEIADTVGDDGGAGAGEHRFDPSSVSVVADPSAAGGHLLVITAGPGPGPEIDQVVSGAIRLVGTSMTYGRYSIRARIEPDAGGPMAGVVALRPKGSTGSTGSSGSGGVTAPIVTSHATEAGPVSAATWHVYTLEWTADRLTVSVDGAPLTATDDPTRIPAEPMDLSIRLDPLPHSSESENPSTVPENVRLLVDWIRIERLDGGS